MLCPKCKFISFDHLLVCGKCHNDLTSIGLALRGTAAKVDCQLFLGSVLSSAVPEAETISEDMAEGVPVEESVDDDLSILLTVDEEPPALEFDETEIPHIDSPVIAASEAGVEEPVLSVPTDQDSVDSLTLAVDSDDGGEVESVGIDFHEVDVVAENDVATLEIDESALTLDSVDEETPPAAESQPKENAQGQMTLDLEEIDLSDLTNFSDDDLSVVHEGAQHNADEGIDFDDTMDLSLVVEDSTDEDQGEIEEGGKFADLTPIDLTLVDDALVELTVDSGKGDRPKKDSGQDDGLQLSMEDTEQ